MREALLVLCTGGLLLGCASSGTSHEPEAATDVVRTTVAPNETVDLTRQTLLHAQEFAAPRARVWQALLDAEGDFGMPLESVDSSAGTVVFHLLTPSPRIAGTHASIFLDCGNAPGGAPRVNTYQLNVKLTAYVESIDGQRTLLRTGVVAYARDRSTTADQLPCSSSGELERRTLAIVAARLSRQ